MQWKGVKSVKKNPLQLSELRGGVETLIKGDSTTDLTLYQ